MASTTLDAETISKITEKEKQITGSDHPVKQGPTAQSQKHAGEPLVSNVGDIAKGEQKITGQGQPTQGGPAATAQSMAYGSGDAATTTSNTNTSSDTSSGKLDSATISNITDAEKKMTGEARPVAGGPTAQAQKHAGQAIASDNLHDITEGEKAISGSERPVKGGPTAAAQSSLGKSRN
jgi:hypothetical protein